MFFPTSAEKTNKQTNNKQARGPEKRYFFLPRVINPGRGTTVVLHTHTRKKLQNKLLQLGRTRDFVRTAVERTVIAASCVRAVIKARANTHKRTRASSHLSSHSLLVGFFFSPVFDERSRWFVPWMVSAPPSPLSDHLHLLLSVAARLWSCAHTGLQHMPETGSVQNMSRLKVPIKSKLAVMKQLFHAV